MYGECHVCGEDAELCGADGIDGTHVICRACGDYVIREEAADDLPGEAERDRSLRKRLARYLYETKSDTVPRLVASGPSLERPAWAGRVVTLKSASQLYKESDSPLQKYERAVLRLASAAQSFGHIFAFPTDRWAFPTMDDGEAQVIREALLRDGYLDNVRLGDRQDTIGFRLTAAGLRYASELGRMGKASGRTVFVAACFSPELKAARCSIAEVLGEMGYDAILIDEVPHNDIVDVRIYEAIRQSKFVVADLTYNRQSVYYEIGFAHGLGLEVVLTCRHDHFDDATNDFRRVHFDLNHRKILVWQAEEELRQVLRQHVQQVFGEGG